MSGNKECPVSIQRNQFWQSLEEGAGKRCPECGLVAGLFILYFFLWQTPAHLCSVPVGWGGGIFVIWCFNVCSFTPQHVLSHTITCSQSHHNTRSVKPQMQCHSRTCSKSHHNKRSVTPQQVLNHTTCSQTHHNTGSATPRHVFSHSKSCSHSHRNARSVTPQHVFSHTTTCSQSYNDTCSVTPKHVFMQSHQNMCSVTS